MEEVISDELKALELLKEYESKVNGNDNGHKRHYAEMCDYAHHLEFHSKGYQVPHSTVLASNTYAQWDNPYYLNWNYGDYHQNIWFARLIWSRRPGEDNEIKAYRANTWKPVTKVPISKVMNVLSKINKASDFAIDFSKSEPSAKLSEENSLYEYIVNEYPEYHSVEHHVFGYLLRELIASDPNTLIAIKPLEQYDNTELPKPFIYTYGSHQQICYESGEYAITKCDCEYEWIDSQGNERESKIYEIWTPYAIYSAYKTDDAYLLIPEKTIIHNFGKLPIWRPRGRVKKMYEQTPICLSFIDEMLPSLDKAAGELSDMDAEVVQHIYSTMWYFAGSSCSFCNGVGKVTKDGNAVVCSKCDGQGVMAKSPYQDIVLRQPRNKTLEGESLPTPPAGYVEKSTEIVKLQAERIKDHIDAAMSAVNMDYLNKVGASQSGIAKRYDRDEAYDFIYPISFYIIEQVLKPSIYWINKWRYSAVITEEMELKKQLPSVKVPEQFEILTSDMIADEIKTLRDGKIDPTIVMEKEIQYANKTFGDDKYTLQKLILSKKLNPFPTMSEQEKQDALLTNSVSKFDVVKSIYLTAIIEELSIEDRELFMSDDITAINEAIDKMVSEKIDKISKESAAKEIVRANIDTTAGVQGA
jgi:hypothetical protein